jgi:glutamate-1-semialdehyde 2,1-aminomutase
MNNVLVSYHPSAGEPTQTQPSCGGQPAPEYADTIVLPWNDITALESLMAERGHEIACILTEPLLANSGCCVPQSGFLSAVVEFARQHGAVSIFDEVITGFRVALGGAREYFGVIPDLSIYGKAIAGGFSLSAVGGRAEVFDCLRDGRTFHAGTYNGNSICLSAAKATLEILSNPGAFAGMNSHGQGVKNALREAAARHKLPLSISGANTVFSLHWGIEQAPQNYRQTLAANSALRQKFQMAMLDRGVYLLPDGRWYVGAAHDSTALSLVTNAIDFSLSAIAG